MNAQLNDCTGKVALVSGAATGIGLACASALAEAGAHVVVSDIDETRIHEAAKSITDKGGTARPASEVRDIAAPDRWR